MCASILQWATFIAVAGYTLVTWRILIKTNGQNALSTVLHLFKDIRDDYDNVEVIHGSNLEIRHGYNGFVEAFHLREDKYDLSVSLKAIKSNNYLATFRYIATNYSILIDKLNKLNEENKRTLTPFILSFYTARLRAFVKSIFATCEKYPNDNDLKNATTIYRQLFDQIKELES